MKKNEKMKIAFYGFAGYRFFLKELIEKDPEKEWLAILPSYHSIELFEKTLGKNKVCYLFDNFNTIFKTVDTNNKDILKSYHGSFYDDLLSDKWYLKAHTGSYQEQHAITTYIIYKSFLQKHAPSYIFFPHMETYDARILFATSKELGIKTIVYAHARNLGKSFFSEDYWQKIPSYGSPTNTDIENAKKFINQLNKNDLIDLPQSTLQASDFSHKIKTYKSNVYVALLLNIRYRLFGKECHYHGDDTFMQKVRTRLIKYLEKFYYKLKSYIIQKISIQDINLNELPKKFIYLPLHAVPESAVNNFEPYFVDQIRAIDLLRINMPNDYVIIIKDHPGWFGRASFQYYSNLRKLPGCILVSSNVSSKLLIEKSSLVVSITGTAALEAFLMNKKAFLFGKNFFSEYVNCYDSYKSLKEQLLTILEEDNNSKDVELVSRIFNIGQDFVLFEPLDTYYLKGKNTTLADENIEKFILALNTHIQKQSGNA